MLRQTCIAKPPAPRAHYIAKQPSTNAERVVPPSAVRWRRWVTGPNGESIVPPSGFAGAEWVERAERPIGYSAFGGSLARSRLTGPKCESVDATSAVAGAE